MRNKHKRPFTSLAALSALMLISVQASYADYSQGSVSATVCDPNRDDSVDFIHIPSQGTSGIGLSDTFVRATLRSINRRFDNTIGFHVEFTKPKIPSLKGDRIIVWINLPDDVGYVEQEIDVRVCYDNFGNNPVPNPQVYRLDDFNTAAEPSWYRFEIPLNPDIPPQTYFSLKSATIVIHPEALQRDSQITLGSVGYFMPGYGVPLQIWPEKIIPANQPCSVTTTCPSDPVSGGLGAGAGQAKNKLGGLKQLVKQKKEALRRPRSAR